VLVSESASGEYSPWRRLSTTRARLHAAHLTRLGTVYQIPCR
jgi:hypothetical protein